MSWFDQGWGLSLTVFLPLVGVGTLLLILLRRVAPVVLACVIAAG